MAIRLKDSKNFWRCDYQTKYNWLNDNNLKDAKNLLAMTIRQKQLLKENFDKKRANIFGAMTMGQMTIG